jgi:spore maturation protein SpmA
MKDRQTVRVGPLAPKIVRQLRETGETFSEYVRRLIADDLGVDPPAMPMGFAAMSPEQRSEIARRAREPLAGVDGEN